jgi:putative phosphoesterase
MRVAALYDIHGNLPALEAVLRDVAEARVDTILVGGDVASGPMPSETLVLLQSLQADVRFIRGNADRVLDFSGRDSGDRNVWMQSRQWVADQLGPTQLHFLSQLPLDATVEVDDLGTARYCHGAPGSDEETITRLTPAPRLRALLRNVRERLVVSGHTHVQFDRTVDGIRVINAGSVGLPYEARPGSYWLLAGPEIALRRTQYDVREAVDRILGTDYPNREAFARDVAEDDPSRPHRLSRLIEFGTA